MAFQPVSPAEAAAVAESYEYSDTAGRRFLAFWKKFRKNKLAVAGLWVLLVLYTAAAFAPVLAPYDPAGDANDILLVDQAPSFHAISQTGMDGVMSSYPPNIFGRDELGRDVLSRCLYAGRISLSIGIISAGISILIGTIWGSLAGYYGGLLDNVLMRIVDAIRSIPTFILLIVIMSVWGGNIFTVMVVLGITSWTGTARFVRAEFLSIKEREFVLAAECSGVSEARVIFRHILPNAIGPIIVSATMGVAGAILSESSLSFFGLGVQPPTASWGNMLIGAQDINTMLNAPWKAFYPGILIFLTVLSFNFVGDGLRDAFDPKLKD